MSREPLSQLEEGSVCVCGGGGLRLGKGFALFSRHKVDKVCFELNSASRGRVK